jgi:hypothetical protein
LLLLRVAMQGHHTLLLLLCQQPQWLPLLLLALL